MTLMVEAIFHSWFDSLLNIIFRYNQNNEDNNLFSNCIVNK